MTTTLIPVSTGVRGVEGWQGGGGGSPPTASYIILTTLFFSCGLSIGAPRDWHGDPLRLIGSLNCVTAREAEQTLSPL